MNADPDVPLRIAGRPLVPLHPSEKCEARGQDRRSLQRQKPRQHTTVTATVQHKTGAQPQSCLALQIRGDHRCFVFEEFNLIYSVAKPHLNAVSSSGSGEGLVEVGTRYLKCLRALTRKNFAEAEALPFGTFEKQCGILYLVPPSNYRRQQTCLVENVVAAGQQGLADLKSREGTRFKSDDTVPGSSEQRSGHAPCGHTTNDQHLSIRLDLITSPSIPTPH